jgi:type III pantothenate kinase
MNLIIEQGNTSAKLAVYDNEAQVLSLSSESNELIGAMEPIVERFKPDRCIISSVTGYNAEITTWLKNHIQYVLIPDKDTPIPLKGVLYDRKTLGFDRLAAAVGARFIEPEKNLLIIDAGTAVTFDIVNLDGYFLGGCISPGVTTRFKALHQFTHALPLVEENKNDWEPRLGHNTKAAIEAGVIGGMLYEFEGHIEAFRRQFPQDCVFLTGGHAIYFEERLKRPIFADTNLVLKGLNRILEYNAKDI